MDEICIASLGDRDRWDAEHHRGGLPSQSWRYARALSESGLDPKLAVVRSGGARMLAPFLKRTWMGGIDVATILGLSGASISPSSTAPLSLWRRYAAAQGWVAGYFQLAPQVDLEEDPGEDELVITNTVFLLDLREDDAFESASATMRQKIRNAANRGVALEEDRAVMADSLKRLYPPTMRRVGARAHYEFSAGTLERWALDPTSVVLGARLGGSVEAVSVFCVAGRQAEYHLNASTKPGRDFAAWLIWNAVTRLRDRGVEVLNLGGGVRPGDGVYRFKERFNGAPTALRAVRQIYDHAKYDELCRRAGVVAAGEWFPAYRARTDTTRR